MTAAELVRVLSLWEQDRLDHLDAITLESIPADLRYLSPCRPTAPVLSLAARRPVAPAANGQEALEKWA